MVLIVEKLVIYWDHEIQTRLLYNHNMKKSISECATHQTLKQMGHSKT